MFKPPPKKLRPAGQPTTVATLLPAITQQLGLNQKVQQWSVLSLWPIVVQESFKEYTQAVKIQDLDNAEGACLLVWVAHSTLAHELTFYQQEYCQKLNSYSRQTGIIIARIRFTAQASFKPTPSS